MDSWRKKFRNMRVYLFLFLVATVISCSSAKELEGHWKYTDGSEVIEFEITSKTFTLSVNRYGNPDIETTPYKVFERGQSFIVLEMLKENKNINKELARFELLSEDKISAFGKVFIRVK